MKKILKHIGLCMIVFTTVMLLTHTSAMAMKKPRIFSTSTHLDAASKYECFEFEMPKDGKIKMNVTLKDFGVIPGSLIVVFQNRYSPRLYEKQYRKKEITGITAEQPVVDLEVELKEGRHYLGYQLYNEVGNIVHSSVQVDITVEVLPTIPVNIPELTVNTVNSIYDFDVKAEDFHRSQYEFKENGYDEIKFGDHDSDVIIPFTIKKGNGVYISMKVEHSGDKIIGRIYKDAKCTKSVSTSFFQDWFDDCTDYRCGLPGKGTYYFKFTLDEDDPVGETEFFIKLYELNGRDRKVTEGKATVGFQTERDKTINYKIKVKGKKLIVVNVEPFHDTGSEEAGFCLLDKNKKPISRTLYEVSSYNESSGKNYIQKNYVIPAGTYYIQMTSSDDIYEFTYYLLNVKKNAGRKKSKAKTIRVQKDIGRGYFTSRDKVSKADWYKFKLTSEQYVHFFMDYEADGFVDFEILDSKGRKLYKYSEGIEPDVCYGATSCGIFFLRGRII